MTKQFKEEKQKAIKKLGKNTFDKLNKF